jgi:hypothetical protein
MRVLLTILFLLFHYSVFSQCILQDNVSVDIQPNNGTYQPGQTITFTYTITDYQGLSVNWMHGIAVVLGTGWDFTTLSPFGNPTNNSGTGVWLWVNSVTSSATGNTINNPGWFYDTNSGGALDGDPGNNWGDGLNGPWTFQFQVTVGDCPPNQNGDDLSVIIENYADGESGSWINYDCQGDPNETFQATIECCPPINTSQILHN